MMQSHDDPVFATHIRDVKRALTYYVKFADQQSEQFTVEVFEFPQLMRADVRLEFPKYTNKQPRVVQDVRSVTAIEGTVARLTCWLNKSVETAVLKPVGDDEQSSEIKLQRGSQEPVVEKENQGSGSTVKEASVRRVPYVCEIPLTKSIRYQLHLIDDEERENRSKPTLSFNVRRNQPPQLKLLGAKDAQVSPLEEHQVQAQMQDDVGIKRAGIAFQLAGQEERTVTLAEDVKGGKKVISRHVVELEELSAKPDDLLSYYFWIEDYDAEGNLRANNERYVLRGGPSV